MATYRVLIPFTGVIEEVVETQSEKEAIEAAIDQADLENRIEWECHKIIVGGNVFYGTQNEIEVELINE